MADDLLAQQFARFNLSGRARRIVKDEFGSFEACADAIRHKEICEREPYTLAARPDLEPTYTLTGFRWGIEFRRPGIGQKTAAEIAAVTLLLGLVTLDECNFENVDLKNRLFINSFLERNGWDGSFLPGRKSGGKTPEEVAVAKRSKLLERRQKLVDQVAEIDDQLSATSPESATLG